MRTEQCVAHAKVGAEFYAGRYLGRDLQRLYSYREQVAMALCSSPQTALVVGPGDGIVVDLLKRCGVQVTTLDIDEALSPNLVGSVEDIPCGGLQFDVSLCCQVLEHLPFSCFPRCLGELRRVTKRQLVLSLPDKRRFASLRIQLLRFKIDFQTSLPRFKRLTMPPSRFERHGHYWEIGYDEVGMATVRRAIQTSGWHIDKVRRVSDLSWHTFFACTAV